jgi:hypothetical protein
MPRRIITDNMTQFKGVKLNKPSSAGHPQMNVQLEQASSLILQGMKATMFHDLEAKGRNWHKELPSILWALWTNINKVNRDTPFNLVCEADAVLPPEIYL